VTTIYLVCILKYAKNDEGFSTVHQYNKPKSIETFCVQVIMLLFALLQQSH